jgi:TolB-like protein/DNA-binding winged helix-turn-helix (wHTH) protein
MNDRAALPHALLIKRSPADLAHEPSFRLGLTEVRPSILQVQRDGQAAQSLEPRMMQVLVVLAQAQGEVVSRRDLVERCWDGRVVGDNAINRIISRLRQLAAAADGADFVIETIPRVGYRLTLGPAAAGHEPPVGRAPAPPGAAAVPVPPGPLESPSRRRWLGAALAAGMAGGLGGAGWLAWRRRGSDVATLGGARVAVLPFAALSQEAGDKLIGIGMADSLVARLSPVAGLVVRSTGSTLRYASPQGDPLQAARELDVDWIVDGSLQRSDAQLRTTARLVRASDGVAVWSGSFDTQLAGIFDAQDQISARVVEEMAAALQIASAPKLPLAAALGGTRNPEAYQLYLAAIWRGQGHRREALDDALRLLDRALALDPGFALAWTAVAWTHRRGLWIDTRPAEVFVPAEAALQRAAALAPGLAEMLAGRGFTRYWYDYDWTAAEGDFRAALAANPNTAIAYFGLAQLLLTQDRVDEGLAHMRQTVELDPMSPVFSVVYASYLLAAGHHEQAQRRLDAALALAPNLWPMHVVLGELQLAAGQADAGIASLRRAAGFSGGSSRPQAVLGVHLAAHGQQDETRQLLGALEARSRSRYVPPTSIAALHAALGQSRQALDALEQAVAVRDNRVVFLKDDPHWRALRGEPRFAALMKQLGLDRFGPGLFQI